MKLIYAIVRSEDDDLVIHRLNREGFSVTKLATTGGFLRSGNTTLLIATEEANVEQVIDILKEECSSRTQVITNNTPIMGMNECNACPMTVDIGGATLFVIDVERFEKI